MNSKWLLFLPQLPASPSTLRVMVWRRMRAVGALGLQNGVWILPDSPEKKQFVEELLRYITEQGASGFVFQVNAMNSSIEEAILGRFRSDRDEEYTEFCERCEALLAELEKESGQEKFTFAELEETEEDLEKLNNWLNKILARDFVGGNQRQEAIDMIEKCRKAYTTFARQVYKVEGIGNDTNQPNTKENIGIE